ncbi:MAG TPA: DNA translocase FtsK 4TM domain-containing protein [Flavobacteriaceae bacterium]|nr:DNA translocase FtsK 4TM domain-containing protein [Flavobacteriaceae bacterium]
MSKKKKNKTKLKTKPLRMSKKQQVIFGSFLFLLGIALLFSFTSYLFSWKADHSEIEAVAGNAKETQNWLRKFGSSVGHLFIYKGIGIASFLFAILLIKTGRNYFFGKDKKPLIKTWFWWLYTMLWLSILLGFFGAINGTLSGTIGYEINDLSNQNIGVLGTVFALLFLLIILLVTHFKITPETISEAWNNYKLRLKNNAEARAKKKQEREVQNTESSIHTELEDEPTTEQEHEIVEAEPIELKIAEVDDENSTPQVDDDSDPDNLESEDFKVTMEVEEIAEEEELEENLSEKLVKTYGEFDPRLELSKFRFPSIDLLKDYSEGRTITINQEELEENKDRIVQTLSNYKINIANIKATVGPTVTLYEIVPEAGIRISRIKNLEDDIALSLAALGIRIIAPIPGKGTIGIEVPNKNPKIVSMRSVIASSRFQKAEMDLPLALGKTISNETFVVDLAKMPHMLVAGATGQGKSVGLNAILTSLLYKKHPAEVKFVLIDPKKVELTLFNKIERHYLAKLPDTEEAIITDTTKVIHTLNSLGIEMDQRYDLLKDAMVRNIKEYNQKFKSRQLNPENGHRFLPYIVLVIDEFADLIMTAGKEIETPIARLAQLARAVGIHLIVATQRPSVNVITGIIKANFPARLAFRVTSKIDSRTILDGSGADQLIGRGDMLFTQGNEITRLQCAFVDTPEVERITDFIGSQKAYPEALLLPEYEGEESGTALDDYIDDRDSLFEQAAEVLVLAQQGSASLLQRKLRIGYNRAGRIIDQLEAAGIVGQFEGSKARDVLVPTVEALHQKLKEEKQ